MIVIITIIKDSKIRNRFRYVWPQERTNCAPQSMHFTYNYDTMKMEHDMEYNEDVKAVGNYQTEELGHTMWFRALKIIKDESIRRVSLYNTLYIVIYVSVAHSEY